MLPDQKIYEAIWHACLANDVPNLAEKIKVCFSGRLKTSYGTANFSSRKMFLSRSLFEDSSEIKQYECVIHLTCHMVVRCRWLRGKHYTTFPQLHGSEWRAAMAATGVPVTTAYCNTPPSEKLVKIVFRCKCNKNLRFNVELAKKLVEDEFFCKSCNGRVVVNLDGDAYATENRNSCRTIQGKSELC